jgi:biotin carboxyl carrier protein
MARKEIKSEITGSVWKIRKQPGDKVGDEDDLMILESMKMEIPVLAPIAGTVTAVHVAPDTSIQEGDLVATIE